MKPPPFDYADPRTLGEAVGLLERHEGEAKVLSGGQSLVPLLNMRLARPALLVDLAKVPGLDYVREADGALAIGAMTRQRTVELSPLVATRHPLLHAATRLIAHPQNRNQGTVGGSLAHADPAAELPAVALAVGATLRAVGPAGERTLDVADFFVTYLTTALAPAEILIEARFPTLPARTGWSVMEVQRRHGDFALAGAIATLTLDGGGRCAAARLVLFGVGATPLRAGGAESLLLGEPPDAALFARAAERASEDLDEPLSDVHASAAYRRDLARVLARRAFAEAAERAADGGTTPGGGRAATTGGSGAAPPAGDHTAPPGGGHAAPPAGAA
jgi:carbon-monoxide dehydrogenase medium subunit